MKLFVLGLAVLSLVASAFAADSKPVSYKVATRPCEEFFTRPRARAHSPRSS